MILGYARTDRDSDAIEPQLEALRTAGCETIFEDRGVQASAIDRPGLVAALEAAMVFDTLVVCQLDRLAASLPDLVSLLAELLPYGIALRVLEEPAEISGSSLNGASALLRLLVAFGQAANSSPDPKPEELTSTPRSRTGRKPKLTADQARLARKLIEGGELRQAVAQSFGVSLPTLRAALRRHLPDA
ncbi:recombinase family protein [Acuticoccus sediminis]|uniref:recombinase family protein n=1 Tax=Acuticoccus sediminis TaxID=2184697 RepID=UPI001CFD9655|nr:recombinase family protein [Acuticoccus sediminis]